MRRYLPLLAMTVLALLFTGCTKQSSAAARPKNNDLGVIEVVDGKPSSHLLADGRVCTITPSILSDGNVKLSATIAETNASGITRKTLILESPAVDHPMTFACDKRTVITVALHLPK